MIQHQSIMNDLTDTTNTLTSQIITNNSTTSNNTECENLLIETKQEPKYAINELENINSKLDDNNNNTNNTNLIVKSSQPAKKQNLKRKKNGQLKSKIQNSKDLDKELVNEDGDLDEDDLDNENDYENENSKLKLENFYSNPYGTSQQYNSNNNYYGMIPNMNLHHQQTQIQYNNQQLQQQQQMYPWMKDGRNQNMLPSVMNNSMPMNSNVNLMGQIGINVNQMSSASSSSITNSNVLSPNKLNQQNNRYFTNGTTANTTNKSSIMIDSNLANTTILSSGSGASTSPSTSSSLNQNDSITTPTTGKISKFYYFKPYIYIYIYNFFS